jgi:hypothetical protein
MSPNNTSKLAIVLLAFLNNVGLNSAFHISSSSIIQQRHTMISSQQLYSQAEEEEETPQLIIGADVRGAIQNLGTDGAGGYLDAAKRRNEEAKAKMMEQVRLEEEEAEAKRQAMKERKGEDNYGPGDLSSFVGFKDDGFEASEGNDEEGGWGPTPEEDGGDDGEEEEPSLLLFGDGDDASGGSGLIL